MEHKKTELVIFTGAGASKPLGYPLANEFFNSMGNIEPVHSWLMKHFDDTKSLDVEDALRLLDPIDDFQRSESGKFFTLFAQVTKQHFQQVTDFIYQTRQHCFNNYGKRPKRDDVEKHYWPFFDVLGATRKVTDFFTTNYDPVTDDILKLLMKRKVNLTDGFDRLGEWAPSEYEKDYSFRLFRLHGSMCYHKNKTTGEITNPRVYNPLGGSATDIPEHLLIYPGDKTNGESGQDIFDLPLAHLRRSLLDAQYAVFIGFAFRDGPINKAIQDAKAENNTLRLIVGNPARIEDIQANLPTKDFEHVPQLFGSEEMLKGLGDSVGAIR